MFTLIRSSRSSLLLVWLVLASTLGAAADKPALPPRIDKLIEVLFGAPGFNRAILSPDGAHLAFTHEINGLQVLDTYEFKTGDKSRLAGLAGTKQITGSRLDQSISYFTWLGPNQLLIHAEEGSEYYSGLWITNGSLTTNWRVDTRGKVLFMSDPLPQNPQTAILREGGRDDFYAPLWCLNKDNHKVYEAEPNPGHVIEWKADVAGAVRLAVETQAGGKWSYLYRENEKLPWRPLDLPRDCGVVTFDASGRNLLVALPGKTGRDELHQFDIDHNKLDSDAISDPVYDVAPEVLTDTRSGTPVGLAYDAEKPKIIWLSPQYAALSKILEGSLPGQKVASVGVLENNDILFGAYSDTAPFAYFRYNPKKQEISSVLSSMPEAGRMKWAPMVPITFPSRDGQELHGYLTLPLGHQAGLKLPLISLSHGGPVARDEWHFNREVQFFAALGYAVLQVNYRGSAGYGRSHRLGNTIEVAEKSVDDVVDGIRWTIAQGYAHPQKIVAYGGSYGGYISLGIATRYPELPAAAVGFAGVYDWEDEYRHDSSEWTNPYNFADLFRWRADYYLDPRKNAERYRAVSPVHFAAQVRCPVMLHHGRIDRVVEMSQTNAMARALRDAGKTVEVTKDPEGIHGFANESQSKTFYHNLAVFLLKYVPPDAAP